MKYKPEALRFLRESRGMRIDALAIKARVSVRQLRYIENGSIPKADTLGRIAHALGVGVEDFYRKAA